MVTVGRTGRDFAGNLRSREREHWKVVRWLKMSEGSMAKKESPWTRKLKEKNQCKVMHLNAKGRERKFPGRTQKPLLSEGGGGGEKKSINDPNERAQRNLDKT